jgi:nucleoside-diphosphate-sugar epimerase
MNILITGAAGFLGSHLTKLLLEGKKHHIRCLVRNKGGMLKLESMINSELKDRLEIIEGNLTSKDDVKIAVKNVDVVYHCAAMLKGATSDMFYNTVIGSRNLLEALLQENIKRIVLVSSFSVYEVATLPKKAVIDENTPFERHPTKRDAYSYIKCKQEMLFREYALKNNLNIVIIRPGVIYGEGASSFSARVGLKLFGCFLHLGNNNILPLTHVNNCALAIALAGEVPTIEGEIFNIHDDDLITSKKYLKMYKKNVEGIKSFNIPYFLLYFFSWLNEKYFIYSGGQLPDIFTRYKTKSSWKGQKFNNNKAKNLLKWVPSLKIEDGLYDFFKYLKTNI